MKFQNYPACPYVLFLLQHLEVRIIQMLYYINININSNIYNEQF